MSEDIHPKVESSLNTASRFVAGFAGAVAATFLGFICINVNPDDTSVATIAIPSFAIVSSVYLLWLRRSKKPNLHGFYAFVVTLWGLVIVLLTLAFAMPTGTSVPLNEIETQHFNDATMLGMVVNFIFGLLLILTTRLRGVAVYIILGSFVLFSLVGSVATDPS